MSFEDHEYRVFRSFPPLKDLGSIPSGAVLVFAPHPDDEVIGCGGLMAFHRERGDRVVVVHMTGGEQGDPGGREEGDLVAVRREESRRALAALKTTFDIEKAIPTEDDQLVKAFAEWMEISAERGYTLIVLDGVENLNNSGNAHELTWLPDPPHQNDQWSAKMAVVSNFQLVVTATTGTPSATR